MRRPTFTLLGIPNLWFGTTGLRVWGRGSRLKGRGGTRTVASMNGSRFELPAWLLIILMLIPLGVATWAVFEQEIADFIARWL